MALVNAAKDYWTTHHNQSGRVIREGHEHRWELARHILSHEPSSVLEFGCGSGRNLAVLRELSWVPPREDMAYPEFYHPPLILHGIDGNKVSVESGQEWSRDKSILLVHGDEKTLAEVTGNSYDVVFTVSVLDHIPHPMWESVYEQMLRIARKAVVLLEPVLWDTADRRTMLERDIATPDIGATPFTWAHDYAGHDPNIAVVRHMPIGLGGPWDKFGQLYELMERRV